MCKKGSFARCHEKKNGQPKKTYPMGGGVSKDTILPQFKQLYDTDPVETTSILHLCLEHTKEHKRQKALDYAHAMAKEFVAPSEEELTCSFDLLDYNGNQIVSLAEIDKYIVERYPAFNNKPALIRAMDAADSDKDGFITRGEYTMLFQYLHIYNKLWQTFDRMDANGDRRIDASEFNAVGRAVFGDHVDFSTVDVNDGGKILFREFCDHIIQKQVRHT